MPLLFLVCTNDLPETVFKVFLFSDDLNHIIKVFGNDHEIKQDLDSILRLSYENNMSFNLSKCH